ncbi:Serine/threonine-protein kinase AKL1 [Candida viswanathii]|uniref:Serine/threonine-protein kinase AKL1 n=1 Tax=Candida viswanathii TaxID=5486 RepID=A0A367XNC6_9ASCO|nr:Serine/threonine-protein kinase AKL1 [Candida viswanathii]
MGNFPKLAEGTSLQVGKHKATVVKYLSEGGFAHIYKVTIDPPENDSNIACLKRVLLQDKNGLNELRKEVEVMKTLRHSRNIVRYYDSHAERLENGTYQVLVLMELCPNGSLLDYMNQHIKTKLSEPQILKIMLDICQGIYEMHKLKLIHRDIKIENVLIDSRNGFQLCDFGSTTVPTMPPQDQQLFNYLSHDILYHTTPQYRAPEMVDLYRGFPIDEKADIWALGCFLYKLCYYTTPFEANGDIAILHASFQFPPLPEYSGDLKNLIIIMLQENPFFRPNIVQVTMLVCKIMKIDFAKLKLKDFYNAGPYNFQALHEYQVHKQNELLRQKQMYYQQQALANSKNVLPPQDQGAPVSVQATQASATSSQVPVPVQAEELNDGVDEQYQTPQAQTTAPTSELSPKVKGASLQVPSSMTAGSSAESLAGFSLDDDLAKDIAEIENLEDAEQRYPSLDEFDLPDAVSQKSAPPLRLTSMKTSQSDAISSKSADVLDEVEAQEQCNKKEQAEKLADDIFSSAVVSPVVESKEQFDNPPPQPPAPANDDDLLGLSRDVEKLKVENNNSHHHQQQPRPIPQPNKSSNRNPFPFTQPANVPQQENNHEHTESKKNNPWGGYRVKLEEDSNASQSPVQANTSPLQQKVPVIAVPSPPQQQVQAPVTSDPSPPQQQVPGVSVPSPSQRPVQVASVPSPPQQQTQLHTQPQQPPQLQSQPQASVASTNPPEPIPVPAPGPAPFSYLQYASGTSPADPAPAPAPTAVPPHIAAPPLTNIKSSASIFANADAPEKPKVHIQESNLIDLEVGLVSASTSPSVVYNQSRNDSDISLIDMDESKLKPTESRPSAEQNRPFKKRVASSTHTPSQLSLQEEVIDFASDDENPDNGSHMNRLKIRSSLRRPGRSRKSGEYKRTESFNGETAKKRLSFFGS